MDLQEKLEEKDGGDNSVDTSTIDVDRVIAIKWRGKIQKVSSRKSNNFFRSTLNESYYDKHFQENLHKIKGIMQIIVDIHQH